MRRKLFFFFFFQAEDGIRDYKVTGVQTCALPIWAENRSWTAANLNPVLDLASNTGADAQIRNLAGHTVASSRGFAAHASAQQYSAPVVTRGHRVGDAVVRFTKSGIAGADQILQTDLLRAIAGAAGLAALLALVSGLALARRLSRPVER